MGFVRNGATPPSSERQALVGRARDEWVARITDKSRNNRLLFYRPLRASGVDLSLAADAPEALEQLGLFEKKTRLRGLASAPPRKTPDPAPTDAAEAPEYDPLKALHTKLRSAWRVARTRFEEKGVYTLRLATAFVAFDDPTGGSPYRAPLLVASVTLETAELAEQAVLFRDGEWELNLSLLHEFEATFKLDTRPIRDAVEQLNDDPRPLTESVGALYEAAAPLLAHLKGCQQLPTVAISNFAFQKIAMVEDLFTNDEQLAKSPLVALLAGIHDDETAAFANALTTRSPDAISLTDEPLILDADGSQRKSILAALDGRTLVIEGPPGTGKSQSIANLIAAFVARRKRVLFVAEKRAALEVVKQRLEARALGHLVLDLHGNPSTTSLYKLLRQHHERATEAPRPAPWNPARAEELRSNLNAHAARMRRAIGATALRLSDVYGQLLRLRDAPMHDATLPSPSLDTLGDEAFATLVREIDFLAKHAPLFQRRADSPWIYARNLRTADDRHRMDDQLQATEFALNDLQAATAELGNHVEHLAMLPLTALAELEQRLAAAGEVALHYRDHLTLFREAPTLARSLTSARGTFASLIAWLFDATFRAARRAMLSLRNERASAPLLLREATIVAVAIESAERVQLRAAPLAPQLRDRWRAGLQRFAEAVAALRESLPHPALEAAQPAQVAALIHATKRADNDAQSLIAIHRAETALARNLSPAWVEYFRNTRVAPEGWVAIFTRARFDALRRAVEREEPEIASFSRELHDANVAEFNSRDLDVIQQRNLVTINEHRRWYLDERNAANMRGAGSASASGFVEELQKSRRRIGFRRLFERYTDLVTALTPCVMASPLAVSELLPVASGRDAPPFDVVVFDEASQVFPHDAATSFRRARQAVVAGDTKQLPPTNFFNSDDDVSDDDHDGVSGDDGVVVGAGTRSYESLIDVLRARQVPTMMLRWHYRSSDDRLIAFSNSAFYESRLVAFPGARATPPVRFHLADTALGDIEVTGEVQHVLQMILDHARNRPDQSLGIVTLGIKHRDRIQHALDREFERLGEVPEALRAERNDAFFIKNLEAVQGDERDRIILSVGYPRLVSGAVRYNFGPLNQVGGERRLNVAVTRARHQVDVVASFSDLHLDPDKCRAEGARLLRHYIAYARDGSLEGVAQREEAPMNAFEQDVYRALSARGLDLTPQHGAAGYRLDFAVKHPEETGRYVLAIECDGASYHSAETARDRDRLRQAQLQRLGWRFHRIWSTEWFNAREQEIERAVAAYRHAIADGNLRPPSPASGTVAKSTTTLSSLSIAQPAHARSPRPMISRRESIDDYPDHDLRAMLTWLRDGPALMDDEELLRTASRELGFSRFGRRIEERLRSALEKLRAN